MIRDPLLGFSFAVFAVLVASVLLCVLGRNLVNSNKKSTRRKADDTSASSSSRKADDTSYDVFLSFSGEDTRKTFADHLYNGLFDASIRVFRDNNELREGENIGTNLLQAIKNSKISIPILSESYASSKWCLQELVEMIKCIKSGHVVLPIFYRVEPTDVRNQKESFGEAFSCLSRKYPEDVEKWKVALQEVASLKGWESEKTAGGHEGDLVKMVIRKVLGELKKAFQLVVPEQLVGIDNAVENVLRLLDDNPNDNSGATQIVGIHGMGGIGKTTLAKVVFNKLSDQFRYRSFIADIRESSQRNGISYLQNQLIVGLKEKDQVYNTDAGIRILESRFKRKKVLILLDDVDNIEQIEALVGKYDWFEMGSRIIITTRIRSVLDVAGVNCKYELEELAEDKSLILFSRHAFRSDFPMCKFESLSRDVVATTGRLPLALKVIGSFLCGKSIAFWQDKLKQLQRVPHKEVQEKLKISYNELSYEEKQIFLDIACFFIGTDLRYASYMWDACTFFPNLGIETLSFMSLIKIGHDGKVQMHDQLRDLGREIVRAEDYNEPMNRSRFWVHEEALEVLKRNKEKEQVRALCLYENWTRDIIRTSFARKIRVRLKRKFTTEQFETLPKLRFLTVCDAQLTGDSRSLLPDLRWLMWRGHPTFAATNFSLKKLVILDLSRSDISEHWEGWRHLEMAKNLKVLDLTRCCYLGVTPNLSNFQELEIFRLKGCRNLKHIDPSIGAAKSLVLLDLQECHQLQKLPQEMCELKKLKELYISKTAIVKIPQCIGYLKKLEVLYAAGCNSLDGLPDSMSHLVNLSTLYLSSCPKLCKLPESIGDLKSLKFLHIARSNKLSNLPNTISKLGNLEELDAMDCKGLGGEVHIDGLSSLKIVCLKSTGVFGFHGTFDKLSRLEKLELHDCQMLQSLPELPASLTVLKVSGQHRTFPQLSHLINLKKLCVEDCPLLESMPQLPSGLLELSVDNCGKLKELPSLSNLEVLSSLCLESCGELTEIRGLERLKSLESLDVETCGKLSNLDGLEHLQSLRRLRLLTNGPTILNDNQFADLEKLKKLEKLVVADCESLVRAVVPQSIHLWELAFWGCHKLLEIKGLEGLKNLRWLEVVGCPSITLPDLSCFTDLRAFVDECSNIPDGPGVTKAKYLGEGSFQYFTSTRFNGIMGGQSRSNFWISQSSGNRGVQTLKGIQRCNLSDELEVFGHNVRSDSQILREGGPSPSTCHP